MEDRTKLSQGLLETPPSLEMGNFVGAFNLSRLTKGKLSKIIPKSVISMTMEIVLATCLEVSIPR